MRRLIPLFVALLLAAPLALAEDPPAPAPKPDARPKVLIKTSHGDIKAELWPKVAPKTVEIFLGLAKGEGTFRDVRDPSKVATIDEPFYDGLIFHRVIKDFMIQGGDPKGDGTGGAGFQFADEISAKALGLDKEKVVVGQKRHPYVAGLGAAYWQQSVLLPTIRAMKIQPAELNKSPALQKKVMEKLQAMTLEELYEMQGYEYDDSLPSKPPMKGNLALANAGPNTNSSQFFINLADTPWLKGKHTVFGKVVEGRDVLEKIGSVSVDRGSRPLKPVKIISIRRIDRAKADGGADKKAKNTSKE